SQRRSPSKKARKSSMPYFSIASRSTPVPKAKPCHSSGSSPQPPSPRGWPIPLPSTSIQPSLPPTTRRPLSMDQPASTSAEGSVNGKKDGRQRRGTSASYKKAFKKDV